MVVIAVFLFLVVVLLLREGAHRVILSGLRAPRVLHTTTPADFGLEARTVRILGRSGKTLFAWFIPAAGNAEAPAVLVMHGWGSNASMMLPVAGPMHAAGYSVLLMDARCHGESDDEEFTSLPRFSEDIEAGLAWLKQQPGLGSSPLAVVGHSVGAGAALLSASRRDDLCAVVSISAFAHPREVMRNYLAAYRIPYTVVGWYVLRHVQNVIGTRFENIAPINTVVHARCLVLLVHGTEDETVPFNDARRIHAAAPAGVAQCVAIPGGHDLSQSLPDHGGQVMHFLNQAFFPEKPSA